MQRRNVGGCQIISNRTGCGRSELLGGKNDCTPVIITVKQRQVQHSGGETDTSIKAEHTPDRALERHEPSDSRMDVQQLRAYVSMTE
jgi:hypothetical protein